MTRLRTPAWSARWCLVVAATTTIGACGTATRGLVDPATLVEPGDAHEAPESRAGLFLAALMRQMQRNTCAMSPIVSTRTVRYDADTEAQIDDIATLGRALCTAGIDGIDAGFDELGAVEYGAGQSGRALGPDAAFVFDEIEPWSVTGNGWEAPGRRTCGGRLPANPDYTLTIVESSVVVLQSDDDATFPVAVERGAQSERCPVDVSVAGGSALWLSSPGTYDIYMASTSDERPAWRLAFGRDEDSSLGIRRWLPGGRIEQALALGPYNIDAWTSYDCTGYIGSEPTLTAWVASESDGSIVVESDGDAVLVVLGPDGQQRCNDDYYGLDPAIIGRFEPGRWEIYVGTYSQGTSLNATVTLE